MIQIHRLRKIELNIIRYQKELGLSVIQLTPNKYIQFKDEYLRSQKQYTYYLNKQFTTVEDTLPNIVQLIVAILMILTQKYILTMMILINYTVTKFVFLWKDQESDLFFVFLSFLFSF